MFVKVLSFGYSSWFSITESEKAKETQKLREVKHIDIEDTEETSETCQNNPGNTGSLMLNFLISHVLQLVLLTDIQVFVKKRVGSTPTCQLSVRFWSKNMRFYRKNFTFSFNFQLTIFFYSSSKNYKWKQICFFVLVTQSIDGRKTRKIHAQDIIREELDTVNAKIVSCTKLKSTVGLSTELSDSLKKLESRKRVLERKYPTCNRKQN